MAYPAHAKADAPVLAAGPTPSPPTFVLQKRAVMEATEDILYGSIAGIVGKYIEYPFDTVKVRLQSQPHHLPLRYTGPLDCFRQSLRADGVLGLYRGISAPLVGAALETSCLFSFERVGRELLFRTNVCRRDEPLSLPALYFTGAFAGVFVSFILTPIELVKCKIQVPATSSASSAASPTTTYRSPLAVLRDIYRHDGLRGFWHGQVGTLIREAGGSASWFGAKETTTSFLRKWNLRKAEEALPSGEKLSPAARHALEVDPLPLWQQATAGASAGMSYNFLFFPADTVKSRMQTSPVGGDRTAPRRTFMSETRALWRQSGIQGFYRGCGITVLRAAPSSAFIFMVYDGLKRYLPLA